MVTSASAQLKQMRMTNKQTVARPDFVQKPQALMQEMQAASATPKFVTNKAPKKASYMGAYYVRPAGLFPGFQVIEAGAYGGGYYMPLYFAKPYTEYAFTGVIEGGSEDTAFDWEYQKWNYDYESESWSHDYMTFSGNPLLVTYINGEENEVPKLTAWDNIIGNMYQYQPGGYEMSGTSDKPTAGAFHVSYIECVPSNYDLYEEEGSELMVSSKTFCAGGRHADQRYVMTYYSGCNPYGDNENGWWFGKNGGRANGAYVDGIAQAFEKPTAPYLLRHVVIDAAVLEVIGNCEMTCRVYKLADGIPAYDPESPVALAEEPGEMICYGRASLTPETNAATGGLIIFTLYNEEDGLEYEVTPTIDDAILICVDGYNDPEMENLKDFSALVSSDDLSDEGYGELAYIKYGITDEEGNLDHYVWAGLNNFFSSGTMMTGMTIFITVDNPFLTFNYDELEDAEYTFPAEGGLMEKVLYEEAGQQLVTRSIEFYSYMPSVDEGWTLTCDGDEVPEWLTIELTDGEDENGEFDNGVLAEVTAEPLPEGVAYREAVVRFEFPGAYLDYKFMQGTKPDFNKYDVDRDGQVGLGDINALTDMILSGSQDAAGDVDGDGEVTLGDLNDLLNYIMSHS